MFTDLAYYLFLGVCVLAILISGKRFKAVLLAVAGVAFYTYYAGAWLLIPLSLTLISWLLLFRTENSRKHAICVTTVITLSVASLAGFKYFNFFCNVAHLPVHAKWAVPLALSFFTFEFIHVAAEVKKGSIENISFWEYAAFIFFFPTMIAGPIKRWNHFSSGLQSKDRIDSKDAVEGLLRIGIGLVKKLVLADNINLLIQEIGHPKPGGAKLAYALAVFLFGIRIFLDFAGYSDIAIGSATLLGIHVPENFLSPYTQKNIAAFWRHWHISLTNWLIDYVYIPLGGNRVSAGRAYANAFIVMIVSGLWHGADWNFLLWGAWHGGMICVHRFHLRNVADKLPTFLREGFLANSVSYVLTMLGVWIGWMMFMWPLSETIQLFHRGGR